MPTCRLAERPLARCGSGRRSPLGADEATVRGLHAEASHRLARERLEATLRTELASLGRPVVELPLVTTGITRESLADLAAVLGRAG